MALKQLYLNFHYFMACSDKAFSSDSLLSKIVVISVCVVLSMVESDSITEVFKLQALNMIMLNKR